MTNAEICAILDQILDAMQQVHHKEPDTYTVFHEKLKTLVSELPYGLLLANIKDRYIRKKASEIWKLFFAKNQYRSKNLTAKLGTLDRTAREILILHKFYLDYKFINGKTILFKLLDSLNISLLGTTCQALHELGIFEQVVYAKLTSDNNMNIFEWLEHTINCKINLPETSIIKLQETQRFAQILKETCKKYNIPHGFSAGIESLMPQAPKRKMFSYYAARTIATDTVPAAPPQVIDDEKLFDTVAARSAKRIPAEFSTLEFLSKRNKWDFFDEEADKAAHENSILPTLLSKPRKPSAT